MLLTAGNVLKNLDSIFQQAGDDIDPIDIIAEGKQFKGGEVWLPVVTTVLPAEKSGRDDQEKEDACQRTAVAVEAGHEMSLQ